MFSYPAYVLYNIKYYRGENGEPLWGHQWVRGEKLALQTKLALQNKPEL